MNAGVAGDEALKPEIAGVRSIAVVSRLAMFVQPSQ